MFGPRTHPDSYRDQRPIPMVNIGTSTQHPTSVRLALFFHSIWKKTNGTEKGTNDEKRYSDES